jgi:hypothetical protein
MEALEHNPRTKQQIKDMLFDLLYAPAQNRFKKRLRDIIVRNCNLTNASHTSVIYRGNVYMTDNATMPLPRKIPLLDDSLKPDMDDYIAETAYLNSHEVPFVLGYINQVLNVSEDLPDYLDLLPDPLHKPIMELIATCPCHNKTLTDDKKAQLKQANTIPISLMKQRLVLNLIQ